MKKEPFYIAIDRDYKGKEGGAGYNRLLLHKITNYELAKFFIEKTLNFIFENEYPTIRNWYSEAECNIDYPILITNDKKLYQVYRNVLNLEEFSIYCNDEKEKRVLIDIHKTFPKINSHKGIMFKTFALDDYAESKEKIMSAVNDIIEGKIIGAKNFDPNFTEYDKQNGEYYETYDPELLGVIMPINDTFFLNNLIEEYNDYRDSN